MAEILVATVRINTAEKGIDLSLTVAEAKVLAKLLALAPKLTKSEIAIFNPANVAYRLTTFTDFLTIP